MKTFLAWAIANLEIFGIFILLPFTWIFLYRHPEMRFSDTSMWGSVMFLSFLVLCAGGCAWVKNTLGDLFSLLLTAMGIFFLMLWIDVPSGSLVLNSCIAGGFGLAFGTVAAVFAVNNFYEVVSLRWIYANSNATKFQESALYGLSRFAVGFHIGAFIYALML